MHTESSWHDKDIVACQGQARNPGESKYEMLYDRIFPQLEETMLLRCLHNLETL